MVERVKSKLNKDLTGAMGAVGGGGFLIAWSSDISVLFNALYVSVGLCCEPLASATEISTDLVVIIGSGIVAYIASKFTKD